MKKTFSFLAIFLVSLLSIFGSYNLASANLKINNDDTEIKRKSEKNVTYPTVDSYIGTGESATLEGGSISEKSFRVQITFNDFEIKDNQIYYYTTIDVTSLVYNDLTGFIYAYDASNNSVIKTYALFYNGDTIKVDQTKSVDLTFIVPIRTQIKINLQFGPQSDFEKVTYTTTSAYLVIDGDLKPTINSFESNNSKTTTNSVSLSWNINDQYTIVDAIEIWDSTNNVMLKQVDSTMLVANDYIIDQLESNTNYNLELKVHWNDDISTNGATGEIKQSVSVNTNAQIPTIDDFSLVSVTSSSAIIKIKYSDPDNVIDSITIHDKNANMNDVVFSPSDLINDEYELANLKTGDYQLELILHWTSLNDSSNIVSDQLIEIQFENLAKNSVAAWVYVLSSLLLIIVITLIILLILYMIRRKKMQTNDSKIKEKKIK